MHDLHTATVEKIMYLKKQVYNIEKIWECDLNKRLEEDEEMRRYFEEHDFVDPLQPRDAFFGGRTNAAKLFHQCKDGERIKYVDFTSLYPWCNKSTRLDPITLTLTKLHAPTLMKKELFSVPGVMWSY